MNKALILAMTVLLLMPAGCGDGDMSDVDFCVAYAAHWCDVALDCMRVEGDVAELECVTAAEASLGCAETSGFCNQGSYHADVADACLEAMAALSCSDVDGMMSGGSPPAECTTVCR